MNIVLEGPDGGGKSTLATRLSELTGMKVVSGEGPPKAPGEINERARRYLTYTGVIFDRHPCVSQPIYGSLRDKDREAIDPDTLLAFYEQPNLLVFVRHTSLSLKDMTVGEHEDPEHVAAVRARYADICFSYERWAINCAHFILRRDMPHFEAYAHVLGAGFWSQQRFEADMRAARRDGQQIPRAPENTGHRLS